MNKPFWVIANWKARQSRPDALEWIASVGPKLDPESPTKIILCPSFSLLPAIKHAITKNNYPIALGSQDISAFEKGAYTGEEPAELLKELINYSLVGHSERRQNLHESDGLIAQKIIQAQSQGITPILCVQGANTPVPENIKLIAYEPVEAIGSGHPDTPEDAAQVAKNLQATHPGIEVLYGGSVTGDNVKSFYDQESLSGVLVGTASNNPQDFLAIINFSR